MLDCKIQVYLTPYKSQKGATNDVPHHLSKQKLSTALSKRNDITKKCHNLCVETHQKSSKSILKEDNSSAKPCTFYNAIPSTQRNVWVNKHKKLKKKKDKLLWEQAPMVTWSQHQAIEKQIKLRGWHLGLSKISTKQWKQILTIIFLIKQNITIWLNQEKNENKFIPK